MKTYHDKVPQLEVTSERGSLASNALHQATVPSEDYQT